MGRPKKVSKDSPVKRLRPALSPEARESRAISLAYDLAEEQLMNGTASSQVITHFLKLGTVKALEETEKLKNENLLLQAKTEAIKAGQRNEEILERALKAFSRYRGRETEDEEAFEEEYYED